jgi:hypothetical protein
LIIASRQKVEQDSLSCSRGTEDRHELTGADSARHAIDNDLWWGGVDNFSAALLSDAGSADLDVLEGDLNLLFAPLGPVHVGIFNELLRGMGSRSTCCGHLLKEFLPFDSRVSCARRLVVAIFVSHK